MLSGKKRVSGLKTTTSRVAFVLHYIAAKIRTLKILQQKFSLPRGGGGSIGNREC